MHTILNQLHFSQKSAMAIETAFNEDLKQSMIWFDKNSHEANPDKFQSFGLALDGPPLT